MHTTIRVISDQVPTQMQTAGLYETAGIHLIIFLQLLTKTEKHNLNCAYKSKYKIHIFLNLY